jgi:hypothetical protein
VFSELRLGSVSDLGSGEAYSDLVEGGSDTQGVTVMMSYALTRIVASEFKTRFKCAFSPVTKL